MSKTIKEIQGLFEGLKATVPAMTETLTAHGCFIDKLSKEHGEMLEMLKELAQIKEPLAYPTYCTFCDKEFDTDHEPDCRLVKLLKEVEG